MGMNSGNLVGAVMWAVLKAGAAVVVILVI